MSDRYCIAFGMQVNISAQDMNSCCRTCGNGYVTVTCTATVETIYLQFVAVMVDFLEQHGE